MCRVWLRDSVRCRCAGSIWLPEEMLKQRQIHLHLFGDWERKQNSDRESLEHRYHLFSWQSVTPVPKQTKAVQSQEQFKALFHPLLYLLLHPSSAKCSRNSSKKLPWWFTSNISNLHKGRQWFNSIGHSWCSFLWYIPWKSQYQFKK